MALAPARPRVSMRNRRGVDGERGETQKGQGEKGWTEKVVTNFSRRRGAGGLTEETDEE